MEKSACESRPVAPTDPTCGRAAPRKRSMKARLTATAAMLVLFATTLYYYRSPMPFSRVRVLSDPYGPSQRVKSFPSAAHITGKALSDPWDEITPSEKLEWHPCYGGPYQCARLTVPMDYSLEADSSCHSPKVHVALVLYPAEAPSNPPRQPMLVNPGGPGGSGTFLALALGGALQSIFGPDQPVLGFDPRGIGFTTPRADCWAAPPPSSCNNCSEDVAGGFFHRIEWETVNVVIGAANSSNVAMKMLNSRQQAVNKLCREKHSQLGPDSILGHASTAHVARDMVSILDAWEEWQDSLAPTPAAAADSQEENSLKGKLVYWGFSYGTYLGAKFASMFPERVGRVLLDGVVDAQAYELPLWKESLHDTDQILKEFFSRCAEAGDKCHLYRAGDDANSVRDRYYAIMDRMETDPMTFIEPSTFTPVVVSPSLVKMVTFSTFYSPIQMFPILSLLLNYIYTEDPAIAALFMLPDLSRLCLMPGLPASSMPGDAQRAIMCADKAAPYNMTVDELRSEFNDLAKVSQFADVWMQIGLTCNGWDISKKHDGVSSWASVAPKRGEQIETAFPILFLSNTHDPVTPLVAGLKMALQFKDAGLIEQQSSGHCTLSAPSVCTALAVVDYIRHGKVPPPPKVDGDDILGGTWTTCSADAHPFQSAYKYDPKLLSTDGKGLDMPEAFERVREYMNTQAERWGKLNTKFTNANPYSFAFVRATA
ncbi:alpha/beta-hydrolase [Thozetella sp. PMI_491]|nr:alpha/beta-hydrolase [Thozetella sp. PMI_491]